VFSFGTPRTFQIRELIGKTTDRKPKNLFSSIWEEKLASGSILRVSSVDNKVFYHAVPKEPEIDKVRYSIIFRTIDTTIELNSKIN